MISGINSGGEAIAHDQANSLGKGDAWQVSVEWDGEKPNEEFRNRIRQITGITARGERDNVTTREDGAKVGSSMPQECLLITTSLSLARLLWHIASKGYIGVSKDERKAAKMEDRDPIKQQIFPKRVVLSPVIGAVDYLEMTSADEANLARVTNMLGRPGRKEAPSWWTVTCLEEARTYEAEVSGVSGCPCCGGQHFRQRRGRHMSYEVDKKAPLVEAWVRSRFSGGIMEFPSRDRYARVRTSYDLDEIMPRYNVEDDYVKLILDRTDIMQQVELLGWEEGIEILDSLAISMINFSPERRQNARVRIFVEFYRLGGSIAPFDIDEDEDEMDIMCAAHYVETRQDGAKKIAEMMINMTEEDA